jgi:Type III flagellar switch regulator (C-ring) FliN C-term
MRMDPVGSVETEGMIPLAEGMPDANRWSAVYGLPTAVVVAVPMPAFRVRDLLGLKPGTVLASAWRGEKEVPLLAGEVQFAWVEFEVTDEKLGARIMRLA